MTESSANPNATEQQAPGATTAVVDTSSAVPTVQKTPKRKLPILSGIVGASALASLVVYWNWPQPVVDKKLRDRTIAQIKGEVKADPVSTEDEKLAEKVIGTWYQEEYGTKTLTIFPGGKAKMVMKPNAIIALRFGPRIDADMYWSVKDGYIDYGFNGGTPADKIKLAKETFGDFWHEKIVHVDDKSLLLIEEDDDESRWKRLPDAPAEDDKNSDQ
jgi:hypothetical protein